MSGNDMELPQIFDNLKYGDLQKYAKQFGIRANLKAEKLMEALKNYVGAKDAKGSETSADETRSGKMSSDIFTVADTIQDENNKKKVDCQLSHKPSLIQEEVLEAEFVSQRRRKRKRTSAEKDSPVAMVDSVAAMQVEQSEDDEIVFKQYKDADNFFTLREDKISKQTPNQEVSTSTAHVRMSVRKEHNRDSMKEPQIVTGCGNSSLANKSSTRKMATESKKSSVGGSKGASQIPRLNLEIIKCSSTTAPSHSAACAATVEPFTAQYWARLHKRQFDQMDSLDIYMKKKAKRALALLSPNRTTASIREKSQLNNGQRDQKKSRNDPSSSVFVPSVFSTTQMNTNFNQMYQDQKPSAPKISVIKEECSAKPKLEESTSTRKSIGLPLTSNPFSPGSISSAQKPKFDLQASLARPLTWKPYIGKLKDSYTKEKYRVDVKNVTVKSRKDRLEERNEKRMRARMELQQNRRGI